ncbi:hypothetical protein PoB_005335800 [Plakobranchus ocellatus]|uniref:Uncharacterized protein n=1 Tax=Plakobranchus ocellatus TaxID=259542 RepID=A0AAV4C5W2_9GAST|nr:hypothetical protein PoB_005335800 [Plakobranchus ocellatus]
MGFLWPTYKEGVGHKTPCTHKNKCRSKERAANEIHASDPDEAKSQKIQFSPASAVEQWEKLDNKIVPKLDELVIGKNTL